MSYPQERVATGYRVVARKEFSFATGYGPTEAEACQCAKLPLDDGAVCNPASVSNRVDCPNSQSQDGASRTPDQFEVVFRVENLPGVALKIDFELAADPLDPKMNELFDAPIIGRQLVLEFMATKAELLGKVIALEVNFR